LSGDFLERQICICKQPIHIESIEMTSLYFGERVE
jgi:hypothetical protein